MSNQIVCAHCGTRDIGVGPDHMCVGSVIDWLNAETRPRVRSLDEIIDAAVKLGMR